MQKTAWFGSFSSAINPLLLRRTVIKTLLVMKLSVVLMAVSLIQLHAAGLGQSVSLSGKNLSIKSVFSEIEKQTGYVVFGKEDLFTNTKPVSFEVQKMPLANFLDLILKEQPLRYKINSRSIILIPKSSVNSRTKHELENVLDAWAQPPVPIRGRVINELGEPLAGISVSVKGSGTVVSTDSNGEFILKNVNAESSLIFSGVNVMPRTIVVGTQTSLVVTLQPKVGQIDEVVITGIVDRKAGNFTGASISVTGAELKKISSNNVFAAISALDPSFRVVPNNVVGGNINQLPEIQMRGQNSFPNLSGEYSANPNAPLFILDGFEVNLQRIVDLDMNLISSITLLKDASATAIYGSRGANGVMVVTTILPKAGKLQLTFNNDFRFTTPDLSVYNLLNASEKLDFEKRVGVYSSTSSQLQNKYDALYNERYKAMKTGVNTNWLTLPVKNAYSNRSSLYLSGGDAVIRYGLQLSADLQSGVMKGQNRNNYSGQFDFNYVVSKFRFRNSVRLFQNKSNESPYGDFSKYVNMNPYWTPFNENGTTKKMLEEFTVDNTTFRQANPLYDASLHSVNRSQYFGFSNNFQVRYNALRSLYFESNFTINKQTSSTDQFYSAEDSRFIDVVDLNQKGSYTARNETTSGYESLTTANLDMTRGRHQLFSTLGFNFSNSGNNYYSVVAEGFPFDRLDNLLFAAQYRANSKPTGDESTVRRVGIVYSGSYTFDNRFLTDVSIRKDGSSQYGTNKRFGNFWSAGIGWNIHNEKFFKKSSIVNRLKLRASYGSTGSLNIPAYSAQSRYNFGVNTSYFGSLGATLVGLGNDFLSWQNVYKANVGVDMVLFRERFDLRADLYRENTRNSLTQVTLAPSTGFSTFSENLGQIQNDGFELSARYKILLNPAKGLLWSINVNAFTNKNILKELSNKLKASNDKLNTANTNQVKPNVLLKEGESLNTIYTVQSLGIDPATGAEVFVTKDGTKTFDWNAADKVASGISQPKWNGNLGSNFMFNGFEVNLIFNYQFGGQLYNQTLIDRVENIDPRLNVDRRAYELGWSKPGDVSQFRRIGLSTPDTRLTSRFVQNDNNLTLSSASVGYNFYKAAFIKKLGLKSLLVTAITNDAFRFSSIAIERGTSNPFARTYSLSLRAVF